MATSANTRSGLACLMQDHLSSKVVSLVANVMPLIYFLFAKDGNKRGFYDLGRFASGPLFAGVKVSKPRIEQVLNSGQYMPLVEASGQDAAYGKVMTMADTMPTFGTNWATATPSSHFKRPFFRWVERADAIMVPKKDIRRARTAAGNEKLASEAVGDLFRVATEQALTTHLQWWNEQLWSAANTGPSNCDAVVWDNIHSVSDVCDTDNVYGGIDRTVGGNTYWQGNRVTAHRAACLEDIVNEGNFTKGMQKKGLGLTLAICGADLFPIFAAEAKAKGGTVMLDGLPDMAEFGMKRPIIRFNNTFVIYDPQCPCKVNSDSKNVVAGFNLDTWTVAFHPEAKFTVDEPFDLSKTDAGKDAIKSQIRTELILACEAPSLNCWWEDVG